MRVTIITFPGSNCDRDVSVAIKKITGKNPSNIWHQENEVPNCDLIILPEVFLMEITCVAEPLLHTHLL